MKRGPVKTSFYIAVMLIVLVSSVLVVNSALGHPLNALANGGSFGNTSTQAIAGQTGTCSTNTLYTYQVLAPYGGTAISTGINYVSQFNAGVASIPGFIPTTTASPSQSTQPVGPGWLIDSQAANSYPAFVNTQAVTSLPYSTTIYPGATYSLSCVQVANGVNSGTGTVWSQSMSLPTIPASCTSATTGCEALIAYPGGGSAPTNFPTSQATWNVNLILETSGDVGVEAYSVYGTAQYPITNYCNGCATYGRSFTDGVTPVTIQGLLVITANQTGIALTAPGAVAITSNSLTASTKQWVIPINSGCPPAPSNGVSSSNPYTCVAVPLTVQETASQGTHHVDLVAQFVDNQQLGFYLNNSPTDPGVTSFPSAASASGIASSFTGFATAAGTGPNAAQVAPFIEQYVAGIYGY